MAEKSKPSPDPRRLEILRIEGHDLRSPLANIRSYASMLLSRRGSPLDPRIQRAAEVIVKNADKGLQLVDDLMDLARADEGGLDLETAPSAIGGILRVALEEDLPAFQDRGLRVDLSIPDDLPPLHVDPARLRRAVRALVETALRRAPEGSVVGVGAEMRQGELWIRVEDEGDRLSSQEATLSFDRDHQTLASKKLAPGIGLALARAIAEAHGGRVGALPRDPAGAVHYLVLPLPGA